MPDLAGRTVLGFVLNGAQGDDDEAHGGHLALVTGRVAPDGAIGDWLVNNFYTLDSESEKGIIAAPVPLDNYLADLNAGQNWYRPSYLLVAVLSQPRAAALAQSALARVYNQFYRHQLTYAAPDDELRRHHRRRAARARLATSPRAVRRIACSRGRRCPSSRLRERSLAKALDAFDYLNEDQTRLLPAAAFEEIFASLRELATAAGQRPRRRQARADARGGRRRARVAAVSAVPVEPRVGNGAGGDDPGDSRAPADATARSSRSFRCRRVRFRRRCAIPTCCPRRCARPRSRRTCGRRFRSSAFRGSCGGCGGAAAAAAAP